jgi:hypothetical protein
MIEKPFDPLVQTWKNEAGSRASASLELRNLAGSPLGWNRAGQETNLIAFGDGTLHFFRRGDFGERGNKPPGQWRGACDPAEIDALWKALEGLKEKDFLGRQADPGEGVTQLQAQCGAEVALITWGPGEPGVDRPGVDALAPLRMLVGKAQAETLWTLRLTAGPARKVAGGLSLPITFANEGSQAVRFLLSAPGAEADFAFKYAVDETDENGPPLQVDWVDAEVRLPEVETPRIESLDGGASLDVEALIPVDLAAGGKYLGQFTYSQIGTGERIAGIPVFAGVAFTGVFAFTVEK